MDDAEYFYDLITAFFRAKDAFWTATKNPTLNVEEYDRGLDSAEDEYKKAELALRKVLG